MKFPRLNRIQKVTVGGALALALVWGFLGCREGSGGGSNPVSSTSSVTASPLPLPTAADTYFVSSSRGDDSWSGTLPEPNASRTDGPWESLDAAVDMLNSGMPGTHVMLRRGDQWTLPGELVVDEATGTPTNPIVLGAYGSGAQPRVVGQHGANVFLIRGSAMGATSHFWLRDLYITNSNAALGQNGVYIGESLHPNMPHHITLSHVTVEENGAGIIMYGDDHLVHGSRIAHNVQGHGMFVASDRTTLQYNEFENNGLPPPDVFYHSLYFSGCDDLLFEYNIVHSATDGVKVRTNNNSVFRYNTIYDMDAIGLHLGGDSTAGSSNNRVEGNLLYRNSAGIIIKSESGVQIDFVDGLVIANNIVANGVGSFSGYGSHIAVTSVPARNVSVVNNLVYENNYYDGIRIDNPGTNIRCDNNVVGQFGTGETIALDPNVNRSSNLEYTTTAAFEDLDLVDPVNLDFTTTMDSTELIDQGTNVSSVITADFEGNPRPSGSGFDIGPYEYSP